MMESATASLEITASPGTLASPGNLANLNNSVHWVTAYRFGPFCLRLPDRILEKDGERVLVAPKVVDTLLVLVRHAGQVVTKEQLMAEVWPDVTVVESGLSRNISVLRKAIEDDGGDPQYIETIPRRGYRFVGALEQEGQPAAQGASVAADAMPPAEAVLIAPKVLSRGGLMYSPWGSTMIFAVLLALLGFTVWHRGEPAVQARYVHPDVRIGQHLLSKLTPVETERAKSYFQKASLSHPDSAEAHAGLALAHVQMAGFGMVAPEEARKVATNSAAQALRLDPNSGYAHLSHAVATVLRGGNLRQARDSFEQALRHDGSSVYANYYYSYLKMAQGDFDGGRRLVEDAMRLDPVSPALGTQYAIAFYYRRDFERAAAECRRVLDREPHFGLAHYYLALSLGYLGRYQEAEEHLEQSGIRPGVLVTDRAWLRARQGDLGPARAALAIQRKLIAAGDVDSSAKLLMVATLGLLDEGIDAMRETLEKRSSGMMMLRAEPRLDPLRGDDRYQQMLSEAGLALPGV